MMFHFHSVINFLGKNASEIAKAERDLQWHKKLLDTALKEAARGHKRDTLIRDHTHAIKALEELIQKLSK